MRKRRKGPRLGRLPGNTDRHQCADGVGQHTETRADLADSRRALEHEHRDAQALQRRRQCHTADPSTGDDDSFRSHRSRRAAAQFHVGAAGPC
jgi:hypothetical protein